MVRGLRPALTRGEGEAGAEPEARAGAEPGARVSGSGTRGWEIHARVYPLGLHIASMEVCPEDAGINFSCANF